MPTSSPNSSDALRRTVVDLLWRQWSALGVAGQAAPTGNVVLDPEALLLCSSVFARHDARMFDEIADWLQRNGDWINLLRLVRLQREHDLGDLTVLGALAEHLTRRSAHAKWKALAGPPPAGAPPGPLFPHLPPPRQLDEIFLRWGWARGPLEVRGLSKVPRSPRPAAFLLQLRAFFGLQSRAEVVAWLLAHEAGHPAQIARETGYFRGSVQNVLNELEVSGLIRAARDGREKRFVADRGNWRFLLTWSPDRGGDFPRWRPWAAAFALLRRAHDLLASPAFAGASDDLKGIEFQRQLAPAVARLAGEWPRAGALLASGGAWDPGLLVPQLQRLLAEMEGD